MNLTDTQIDTLQELVNVGVGRAAGMLNQMVNSHIELQVPFTKVISLLAVKEELERQLNGDRLSAVQLEFIGSFSGIAQLVFPTDSAAALVSTLTGERIGTFDLDSVKIGTLSEVGNIVINGVMGSISNVLEEHLDYSLPVYVEDTVENLLTADGFESDVAVLLSRARFNIEHLQVTGDIILIFKVGSFDVLLGSLNLDSGQLI